MWPMWMRRYHLAAGALCRCIGNEGFFVFPGWDYWSCPMGRHVRLEDWEKDPERGPALPRRPSMRGTALMRQDMRRRHLLRQAYKCFGRPAKFQWLCP